MSGKHLLLLFLGLVVLTTPSIARLLAPTIVSLDEGNEDLALEEENPPTIHVAPIDLTSFGPLPIQLQGEDLVSLSEVSKSAEVLEPEQKHKHKHHKEHHKPHAPPPPEVAEAPESEHKHKHHAHEHHAPPPPEVAEAPEFEHKHKHHQHAPPPEFAEAPHAPPPEQDASDS